MSKLNDNLAIYVHAHVVLYIYIRKRDERINSIAVIRHIQGNRHTSVCTYIVSYVRSYFCCVGPVEMPTASNRCKEYIYIYLLFTLYTYYISRPYRLGWLALFIDIYNSRPVVVQCTYIIVSPNFDVFVCLDPIVFLFFLRVPRGGWWWR